VFASEASYELRLGQQFCSDARGVEEFARDLAGSAAMASVVGINGFNGVDRLVDVGECKETFTGGKDVGEAGVLGDDRFSAGEIADVALAEPAAVEADVLVLGNGELRARSTDVGGICAEDVEGQFQR